MGEVLLYEVHTSEAFTTPEAAAGTAGEVVRTLQGCLAHKKLRPP